MAKQLKPLKPLAYLQRRASTGAAIAAQKGPLTWAYAGAACRNRTDDLLITSQHALLHASPQQPSHLRKRT